MNHKFDRQQRDDTVGDGTARDEDADQIPGSCSAAAVNAVLRAALH